MILSSRLKGNALFLTIVISLIIGIFCSLLLAILYSDLRYDKMVKTSNKLRRNLRSAIKVVLADTALAPEQQTKTIELFNEGKDTAVISTGSWGLFSVATVSVRTDNKERSRSFFFGQDGISPLDGCLYLSDKNTALALVGHARLTGNAYLPKEGLRPAYIDQRGYDLTVLIRGTISNSADTIPAIDQRLLDRLTRSDKKTSMSVIPDSLDQSFSDTLMAIHRQGSIQLSSCHFKGHIIISSDSLISVNADADLENVILSAPTIAIRPGFSGIVQLIATDSIIVGDRCILSYPSCLVLCKTRESSFQPIIRIGEKCLLNGALVSHSPNRKDELRTYVEIGKGSILTGYVYVSGFLDLNGAVHGAVLADHFLARSGSNVLVNYLVDGEIDRPALSKHFTGPHIFPNAGENKVVQWVDQ